MTGLISTMSTMTISVTAMSIEPMLTTPMIGVVTMDRHMFIVTCRIVPSTVGDIMIDHNAPRTKHHHNQKKSYQFKFHAQSPYDL